MAYSRLEQAIDLAINWHRGQWRDGECPLPYITHPLEVLANLRNVGQVTNEDLLCVAVLHDLFEETKVDPSEIEALFGPHVLSLVRELTRREPTTAETKGMSKDQIWQLRANMLLAEIAEMSPDAQQVKLADRLSNIREAQRTKTAGKLDRYLAQTKEILRVIPRTVNVPLWRAIREEARNT